MILHLSGHGCAVPTCRPPPKSRDRDVERESTTTSWNSSRPTSAEPSATATATSASASCAGRLALDRHPTDRAHSVGSGGRTSARVRSQSTPAKRGRIVTSTQIPSKAVSDENDLLSPTQHVLQGLNLLGTKTEIESAGKASAAFVGPPDSVAVLEAGATAFSKWWAAGIGASAATLWATIGTWWAKQSGDVQVGVIWAAAVATAAMVLGLAYIVGSDVRGRAAGTVATIDGRVRVAEAIVTQAAALYRPEESPATEQIVPLAQHLMARWTEKSGADEDDWLASALKSTADGSTMFLLSKGARHQWVSSGQVELAPRPAHADVLTTLTAVLTGTGGNPD